MSLISNILNSITYTSIPLERGSQKDYINQVENGSFKDKFVYAVSDKDKGFLVANYFQAPNALFCGSMGSGKSIGALFTLSTHFITNSEKTVYICYDQGKSMGDFSPIFPYDNVITALGDPAKITPLIDMLYEEMMTRQKRFKEWGLSGLLEYEQLMKERYILFLVREDEFTEKDILDLVDDNLVGLDPSISRRIKENKKYTKDDIDYIKEFISKNKEILIFEKYKGLGRFVTVMEEFSFVITSQYMNFHKNVDKFGSTAYKFEAIMKLGRSYGIFFLFATQRATADHVPSAIKSGILTYLCFKMNNMGDAAGITGVEHAAEIESKHPGRCAINGGAFGQFPYIKKQDLSILYKKYYKPFEAELFAYSMSDYKKAFEAEGNSGMTLIKPIVELVENYTEYEKQDVVKRILIDLKFDVTIQKNKAYLAELIAEKKGKKYAIKIYGNERSVPEKQLNGMKNVLGSLGCDSAIVIFLEDIRGLENSVKKIDSEWESLDKEDLMSIGRVLGARESLEETGKFNEIYPKLKLAEREDIGLLSEEEESDLNDISEEFSLQSLIDDALSTAEKEIELKPKKTKSFLARRKEIKELDS